MQQKIHNKHALTIEQLLEKHAKSWAKRQRWKNAALDSLLM